MTVLTDQKLITAEEFADLPEPTDGSTQELIRGVIVTMPPPGGRHGACCANVTALLHTHVKAQRLGTIFANDTGFVSERDPDTVRGPDVSFWTRDRLPEVPEGYIEMAPDLAVEVISPHDRVSRMQTKLRHYLARGVRMIWVIDPDDRSVSVYRALDKVIILTETDTLSGEDVLLGFSCRVADLFP